MSGSPVPRGRSESLITLDGLEPVVIPGGKAGSLGALPSPRYAPGLVPSGPLVADDGGSTEPVCAAGAGGDGTCASALPSAIMIVVVATATSTSFFMAASMMAVFFQSI
ncbi:hypothetical protein X566_23940 [Afipia sp. P52-10]|nr:hypothetical protein X566_23940 [Afipia sp. P52-10]